MAKKRRGNLHPAIPELAEELRQGKIGRRDFLRFFSLPNSDYIPLGQCFVALLTNGAPSA